MNNPYKENIEGKYNPFELCSIWFHKQSSLRGTIPEHLHTISPVRFFIKSSCRLIKIMFKSLLVKSTYKKVRNNWQGLDNQILFFTPTLNNQKAVDSVLKELDVQNGGYVVIKKAYDRHYFPMFKIGLISCYFVLWFTKQYQKCSDFDKKIVLFNLNFFLLAPGTTWFYKEVLNNSKVKGIVLANDHMAYCRSLALVCEDYGIKTVYIQHASVSSAFPELPFSFSFLDGLDSFEKYTEVGKNSRGNLIVLGALRYDSLSKYRVLRFQKMRYCVGVAINELDDNVIVNNFCNDLLSNFPDYIIKIRSHPALKNRPFIFDNMNRIICTCATDETIIDYLDSIDFQVSGDSGIHFDAILGGVPTIVYNFSNSPFADNYKYVERNLVSYAHSFDQVLCSLKADNHQIVEEVIKYYDASYGKSYAGNCSKIVASFITNGCRLNYLENTFSLQKCETNNKSYFYFPA